MASSTSSSSSASTTIAVSNDPIFANRTLVVINVATQAPLKLTESTYFAWRKQFDALLIGYDLYDFIDGSLPCPSPVLTFAKTPNPDYTFWVCQDSLLLSAILASLHRDVHRFVSDAETSREAWQKLATTFAKPSCSRLMRLQEQLIRSQGSLSISDYLQDVKGAANELALIDNAISEDELVLYILNGLSSDFENISAALCTRDTPISFEEIHEKLMEHANYKNRNAPKSDGHAMTVHAANRFTPTFFGQ